jgi:hypothetical protein
LLTSIKPCLESSLSIRESVSGLIESCDAKIFLDTNKCTLFEGLERVKPTLVTPPYLPKHKQKYSGSPRIIEMEMVIEEKEIEIEPGVFVQAMTFNGSNPGPLIVVHEGDDVFWNIPALLAHIISSVISY